MQNTNSNLSAHDAAEASNREILSFILDNEEFGVDILCVKEIRVWTSVTEVPNTPSYLKGVINLRGTIIPIIDLSERFQRPAKEYNETTVVIILHAIIEGKETVVGIVVDAVSDVYKFDEKQIRPAPDFGSEIDSRFINGMATLSEKIIILLNSSKLLDADELYRMTNRAKAV
ncbi:purine-binding chemotaxis protein CheW [Alteromonadaceae bacterium M269]|nr:purine-binding chemotaxis protein CheW [Alteromonadaceae bacterium M269]